MLAANCLATLPNFTEAHSSPIKVTSRRRLATSFASTLTKEPLGEFIRDDLVPYTRSLQSELPDCIPEDEADRFLKFMRRMLCWLPEERATARELKNDPWLNDYI